MGTPTREKLLDAGLQLLLERGYNGLGIQELLRTTQAPKGAFYHHFESKQDFALQVVDRYMEEVHQGLKLCLEDDSLPPLERIRRFFELSRDKYSRDGYLGCMLGGLGQELSGTHEAFRTRIEACFAFIADRFADCIEQARLRGEVADSTDPLEAANLLLDCWEGGALRCRLWRDPEPLNRVLDFCFGSLRAEAASTV